MSIRPMYPHSILHSIMEASDRTLLDTASGFDATVMMVMLGVQNGAGQLSTLNHQRQEGQNHQNNPQH